MRLLKSLNAKYKWCRWLQWITLVLSVMVSVTPGTTVAIKVARVLKEDAKAKWSLAGFAIFILCVAVLIVLRALDKKFAHKLPWALQAALWMWVMTIVIYALQKIIVQAAQISLALAIGTSAAFVLSLVSDVFKVIADGLKEEYKIRRIKGDV